MKVLKTGPSSIVFTLASDADAEAIRETARDIFTNRGIVPDGALELDTFVSGPCAVVFARCTGELFYGFDTLSDAFDAALACESVPSKLIRYGGRYYIAVSSDYDSLLCEYAPPTDAVTAIRVLEEGSLLCDDAIAKLQKGVSEWNGSSTCAKR